METTIINKRGKWCVRKDGRLRKFTEKEDAYEYAGLSQPVEEEKAFEFSNDDKVIEEIEAEEIAKFEDPEDY